MKDTLLTSNKTGATHSIQIRERTYMSSRESMVSEGLKREMFSEEEG